MGNTLFISDLHFGHENILSFDNRPFKDIQTHDEYIINSWNDKVGIDDNVWILGDISWHNSTKTIEIFKQLNTNETSYESVKKYGRLEKGIVLNDPKPLFMRIDLNKEK